MRTLFHALLLTTAAVLFCGCFSAQAAENVYMGVQMTAVSEPPGIQVEVVRDSPAERSGLRSGDIIIAIEGTALAGDPAGFLAVMEDALQGKQVGDPLKLTVYRAGPQMVLTIDGEKYVTEDPLGELEALALNAAPGPFAFSGE
jgi:S1-C subfamily serine protease